LKFGEAVCGCVASGGRRIIAEDIQNTADPRANLVRSFGVQCYVCHPLISSTGRLMGTLSFGTKRRPYMEPSEIDLLRTVCDYVAIAFARADGREAEHTARVRAQEAVDARDEFLSVASHELKTPITSMLGFAQLSLRRVEKGDALDPERTKRSFEVIEQQAKKLATLTSQLLDISRIESGRLVLEPRMTDLAALLERVAAAAQMNTNEHAILLTSPAELWATVDPLRLEQVAVNLLDNAVKYSPDGGDIEIALTGSDSGPVRIAVRDHGLGIPAEEREIIFERYYQGHRDRVISGLGLGLYITQQIVTLHRGSIEAQIPEDGGTRFVVTLPC
jgi:signal transduction histidine kinase